MADGICWRWLPAGASRQRGNEPSQALRASSPEGRAKAVEGALLASLFGRGGCDQREQTERAPPLPCGELPPQRLRGLQIGEARKMLLAKRLAFFRFDFSFGIIKGEQPLIRGSSASKSLCPCRAKHAAFASQTGLRLKSPTGAFMPSGHRRPFWFSFVRQKRTNSARLQHIEIAVPLPR